MSARRLSRLLPTLATSTLPPPSSSLSTPTVLSDDRDHCTIPRASRRDFTTSSHHTIATTVTQRQRTATVGTPRTTYSRSFLSSTTPIHSTTRYISSACLTCHMPGFPLLPVHSSSHAPAANPRQEFPSTAKPGRANSARGAAASAPQTRRWRGASALCCWPRHRGLALGPARSAGGKVFGEPGNG